MNIAFPLAGVLVVLISFFATLLISPKLMRRLAFKKLVSRDMNKPDKPSVPKYGGIAIVFGFALAVLISLQLRSASMNHELMLAAICSTVIIALIGLLDDVLDIPDKYRVLLPVFAALPLIVVKAGTSVMNFYFFTLDFNLGVYTLPMLGPVTLNLKPARVSSPLSQTPFPFRSLNLKTLRFPHKVVVVETVVVVVVVEAVSLFPNLTSLSISSTVMSFPSS